MGDGAAALAAALADRYRIERELGAGGMATVYLAQDLKHDRKVAIKVLKPELAALLGAERFVVEIKTTAALQHPHILPLFDSGEAGGFLWYAMPYIEGETLRNKLDRESQLGVGEAVRIASDVADALDYAHRHGVIHRDIKPENILLHDGRPMVADFGIALALSAAAGGRMTETGMSLGTPHYMSPEQATAERDLTNRSDIYSLGSVLYEMLTGEPPHIGNTAQAIIMKIVTEDAAPVTRLRKSVPPNVAAAVGKSLERVPADRFETARAFADALNDPNYSNVTHPESAVGRLAAAPATTMAGSPRPLYAALALSAALLALALWGWLRPVPTAPVSRQRVILWHHPRDFPLDVGVAREENPAAIAPDGSSIVYSDSSGGSSRLMRKLRGDAAATPMAGTDGGISPFFSPDGKWVGYRASTGELRKVPIDGGGSIALASDGDRIYTGSAWLDDGTIVYITAGPALRRVSAAGGASRPVQQGSQTQRYTIMQLAPLPGSKAILYVSCPGNCGLGSSLRIYVFADGSDRLLLDGVASVWYSPTGHLVYTDRNGGLSAVGFDLKHLKVTTGPVPLLNDVVPGSALLSADGTLLYSTRAAGSTPTDLLWVARDGSAVPVDSTWRGDFDYPALSPDGQSLAVSVHDGGTQLWVRRADGTRQKLTQEGTANWRPAWTPNGQSILFASNRRGSDSQNDFDLYETPVDGSAAARLMVHRSFGTWEGEFTPDGQWLIFRSDEIGHSTIRARRLTGDTTTIAVVVDQSSNTQIALSPDGRWLAYSSDRSGESEIYITPFPSLAFTRLVSRDDGTEPRWSHNGRELFFRSSDWLTSVPVTPGPSLVLGSPRRLFEVSQYRSARNRQEYDVAPDGQHFIMIRNRPPTDQLIYVENWFPELLAKARR